MALAGFREAMVRDAQDRVERHFVILCFAARWQAGEPVLNEELSEARWLDPAELAGLQTTPGLADIVAAAFERLERERSSARLFSVALTPATTSPRRCGQRSHVRRPDHSISMLRAS